ncbi:MAG: carboxypeptidase-like regulatory domain-containing protein [Candidatus Acidiferrum sp.]
MLSKMDKDGNIRVQVSQLYRGTASGEIPIAVSFFYQKFREGETYLFFTDRDAADPDSPRINEQCATEPLSVIEPDELAFLSDLRGGQRTGSIFGELAQTENFYNLTPLSGITIGFKNQLKNYSVITDAQGKFEIPEMPAGVYHVEVALPETLRLWDPEDLTVYPHGCMPAVLYAVNNATISGRITLPPGVTVEGTQVTAKNLSGHFNSGTQADSQGRYEIVGVRPGEYVIGIIKDGAPRVAAPYPTTYFPGTTNFEEAKKFVITGADHFADVDINAPNASKIVNITVKATFENGRPVVGQALGTNYSGLGLGSGSTTNSDGITSIFALAGEEFYVMGMPIREKNQDKVDMQCLSPVKLGPTNYPEILHVVYSEDGCRVQFNIEATGHIHSELPPYAKFSEVKISVNFADGAPAENASVNLSGKSGGYSFGGGFHTDKYGELTLPIPEDMEFTVEASFFQCYSQQFTFNTENGIRWRETKSASGNSSAWNSVGTLSGSLRLVLAGSQCKSPTR